MTIVVLVLVLFAASLVVVSPAVVLVLVRRHSPWLAIFTGALTTFGITVLVGLAVIVATALSGGFDPGENCDEICSTGEWLQIAVIVLLFVAVPTAVIGGFISALASLVLVRPKDSA